MYVTSGPASVVALDLKSGRPLWQWTRPISAGVLNLGFPRVNRGVAVLDDMVYVGTLDGYLVALDARSGTERWIVPVGDNASGHSITAAPLVVEDKVLVGISGGEAGIRGFLDAYDARTGKRVWRFWTIPAPGEAGSDTWPGDSWKTGGGATWLTGSYDPALETRLLGNGESRRPTGTANPGKATTFIRARWSRSTSTAARCAGISSSRRMTSMTGMRTRSRCSSIARSTAARRRGVAMANRNGFFYLLDRRSGEFLLARQYAKQTWAEAIDPRGRPIVIPGMEPSEKGTLVYPSLQGATNWASPSFSPLTGLMYVAVREMGSVYFKSDVEYRPGTYYTGGSEKRLDDESWGSIRALHVDTGATVWDFKLPSPPWGGVLSTAGGLVFGGSNEGNVFALDAKTGDPLWQFQAGGPMRANPMSFLVKGVNMSPSLRDARSSSLPCRQNSGVAGHRETRSSSHTLPFDSTIGTTSQVLLTPSSAPAAAAMVRPGLSV